MCASVRERPASGKCDDSGIDALESLAKPIPLPFAYAQLWMVSLNLDAGDLNRCAQVLSSEEISRGAQFIRVQDQNRYTAGRGMLRAVLARFLGLSPQTLTIAADSHGKPILPGHPEAVYFNLSHADDCMLVAVSSEYEIGVDLESSTRDVDHDALASRFFSTVEQAEFQRIPQAARREAFLKCWTRKEAVAKALGQGLRIPLDTIEVTVAPDAPPRILNVPTADLTHWTLHDVNAGKGFVATLALRRLAL